VYVGRWNKISTFIGEQAVMGMAGSTWPRFLDVQNGGIIYGLYAGQIKWGWSLIVIIVVE
jgi:hypothetical protein